MRPVILYITASLDGFIAEPGGGMGWLDGASSADTDFGYAEFYASIDTMLMGSATYEFLLREADPFPHANREVFVFVSRDLPLAAESVALVRADAAEFVRNVKAREGGTIWLVGGGKLNSSLLDAGLIDEIQLFVQPVVLGGGVPLFASPNTGARLTLETTLQWPLGVVELRYRLAEA
ncbi:MAG: dihydrofolate reductase family protein [Coriobacteriia bacterium]|nr:dihydrofolate reductase family protein [Coriobacteriia bacterium]